MKIHAISAVVVAVAAFSGLGCAANTPADDAPSSSSSQALLSSSGSISTGTLGYDCTSSGYCQCEGTVDCNNMFNVCKAYTYCTVVNGELSCCCWNFTPLTTTTTTQLTTTATTVK